MLYSLYSNLFLPLVIASGLPWLIATVIIVSAGITIIREMKVLQPRRG